MNRQIQGRARLGALAFLVQAFAVVALWLSSGLALAGHDDSDWQHRAIQVVSSDPKLISGGNALVRINVPRNVDVDHVVVAAAGHDMSSHFKLVSPGRLEGLVDQLPIGPSIIDVRSRREGDWRDSLAIQNWPITGPIISGPHQTPFECQTSTFALPDGSMLGAALDADCSANTVVTYMYLQTGGTALVAMPSTTAIPADAATTTTLAGATVPFVVRVETSTVDRGIFQSAVLHNPTKEAPPSPSAPPKAWNRKLIAIEGYGCPGGWYVQGNLEGNLAIAGFNFSLLDPVRLGEGYATFANTLQHASNNCNAVLESEAAMMSKEHVVKTLGVPVFTVSAGCSGGSYGSSQLADRIPGLFDGVLISCTFPDPLAIAFSGSDGHLLSHFWAVTAPTEFSVDQQAAVSGYKSVAAFLAAANQSGRTDPVPNRVDVTGYVSASWSAAVPLNLRYDPVTNPTGARPTVYDANKNMYGVERTTGFALRPFDNVGVQYGLAALNAGTITTTQFLDLNAAIGGYDHDANYVPARTVGDPGAIFRGQEAGLQNSVSAGLTQIPIFDVSGIYNDDGGYHYQWFHFAMRQRLREAAGDTKNHVMWRGNPVPATTAWSAFIEWVTAYKNDNDWGSQRDKVIRARPATLVDGCWSSATDFIAERQTLSSTPNTACNTLFPSWTFPRKVAGGPLAANIMKCALKPISSSDYSVSFNVAETARLATIFPSGVCDWSRRGQYQTSVVPDGSFGPSRMNLVYDITAHH
jgi:hypothetical protein